MGAPTEEGDGAEDQPVGEMSYTEASAELDEIVGFFEGRDVDVDQLVGRLVRATAIIEELDRRLRQTRVQVEQLVPRLAAVLEEAPVEEPAPVGSDDDVWPDEVATGLPTDDEVTERHGRSRARDAEDDDTPGLF